jgi:cytochrome c peroxidase
MNPNVMNMTFPEIVERLKASPEYAPTFNAIYGGVSEANFREALATYERSLNTPGARFDRFLRGETDAIDDDERRGFELFKSHGCSSCHQGVNVGGNLLQRFGVLKDYFAGRTIEEADLGLYTVTKLEADKHVFRVPSLRNVALTAPYFHNGSVQTLDEAVRIMAEYQLGRPLAAEQTRLIVAFLGTLTSDLEQVQ